MTPLARPPKGYLNGVAALVGLAVVFFYAGTSAAEISAGGILVIDADRQFAFAESLFDQRKFSQAATEYDRFIHFFPGDERTPLASFKIGQAYFKEGRWQPAIRELVAFAERFKESRLAVRARFTASRCYLELGDSRTAVAMLTRLAAETKDPEVADQAWYTIGWIHMDALDWKKARLAFDHISPPHRGTYNLPEIYAGLQAARELKSKNPRVAGVMALAPGAGFAYCQRYRDALIALVANGLVIWAAVDSFDNGNDGLGVLLSVLGAGFYGGSIYGSIACAHKYNRRQAHGLVERLKQDFKISLAPTVSQRGGFMMLTFRF